MEHLEIDKIIANLAKTLLQEDTAAFEAAAQTYGGMLQAADLPYLRSKFHDAPQVHFDVDSDQLRLGEWMSLCQFAIFELVYHIGAAAVPFLETIAYGDYDWTQSLALETLCRLYTDGILPATVIADIDQRLGKMRYETHLYFARALLLRRQRDERFSSILQQISNTEFQEAVKEIRDDVE